MRERMKDSSGDARRRSSNQPPARGNPPAKKPKPRRRRFDKRWLIFLPALGLIYLAFLYAQMAVTMPSPADVLQGGAGLQIFDRNGQLVQAYDDDPTNGKILPLSEISPYLIDATVSTEDEEYWSHPGVNIKGLARAAYENVAFWKNGGFFNGSGGSSITQQLAKNLFIKPEDRASRSPIRKLREAMMAFEMTRRYSKEEILEWYLGSTYYGNGAYGIEAASYRYLNKPPSDLTLAEAALLAGLPQAPNYYNPISNVAAARERQTEVLHLMVEHGIIEQAQMDQAMSETVVLNEGRPPDSATDVQDAVAPHFAEYVRELLPTLIGQENVKDNLKITTTLDLHLQQIANDAVRAELDKLEASQGVTNGALVSMDPKTGEILAMVGSHDFFRDDISGQVNNATALNQPGSTIKPVTYLAAFMNGAEPDWTVVDQPIDWGPDGDVLGNADGWYRGTVQLQQALGSSLNVPAVETLQWVGLDKVKALAKKLGITSIDDDADYGAAFTLGAFDTSLVDMTYVYSTFANQGVQAGISSVLGLPEGNRDLDPIAILKVERDDGKVLWQADITNERVAPADDVYKLSTVLSNDQNRESMFGLNSPLNLGIPAAVKSGSSDETRDAWTIGYTPSLVTGVWVGNANNDPIPGGTSTYTAAPIWHSFMLTALQGQPVLAFTPPGGNDQANADKDGPEQVGPTPAKESPTPRPTQEAKPTKVPTATPAIVTATPGTERRPPPTATPRATSTPTPPATAMPTRTPAPSPTRVPTQVPRPTVTPRAGNN
jgi:membrane peptidoglycan carboxypeptidase